MLSLIERDPIRCLSSLLIWNYYSPGNFSTCMPTKIGLCKVGDFPSIVIDVKFPNNCIVL